MTTIPNLHQQLVELAALVGIVLPLLVSVLKQDKLSDKANTGIVMGACVVAGVVTAAARGQLTLADLVQSVVTVVVTSNAFYKVAYQPLGIGSALQTLTSFHKAPDYTPVADAPTAKPESTPEGTLTLGRTDAPADVVEAPVAPVEAAPEPAVASVTADPVSTPAPGTF